MSSVDLFNQARGKRDEAMLLRRKADALQESATWLSGTFGTIPKAFGAETWRGPNATRVLHLLDDCHRNQWFCTGQLFDDATVVRLTARDLDEAGEILESDGRLMARVEAETEAARQRAAAEADAARMRTAQAAASASTKATPPTAISAAVAPAITFAPIITTSPASGTTPSNSLGSSPSAPSSPGHEDSDYSGWY
jgi:hypothetical protein